MTAMPARVVRFGRRKNPSREATINGESRSYTLRATQVYRREMEGRSSPWQCLAGPTAAADWSTVPRRRSARDAARRGPRAAAAGAERVSHGLTETAGMWRCS